MRSLIALVAITLTIWSEWMPAPTSSYLANEWLRDHFIRLRASTSPESRLAVIDIDENSLTSVGPWPWPRERIAALLENLLGSYNVRGVALDMVFPEPADAAGDTRLAMLAQHGPVVLAQAFDYSVQPLGVRVGRVVGGDRLPESRTFPKATGFIGNHAGLAQAAHVGNIGFVPDDDGMIRRLPVMTSFDGRIYPSLSRALMGCCVTNGNRPATTDRQGFRRIPFDRDWSAYTVIPASAILNQSAPPAVLQGRLVVVGSSALGLTDRVATPLLASTPGMLVHAAALSSLLDEEAGVAPSQWPGRWIAMIFTVLVALMATYTFPRLSAVANVGLLVLASLLWLGLAYVLSPHDASFSTTAPLAANLFLLAVAVPFDWQLAQRKSRQLLGTLRQYVAKAVVDELLRRGLKDPLTPQRLNVTTLIADMEGYTGQVESLTMEEAAQLTRDFLACLTKPVLEKHGTIDKFTGDGLVAFWGAPLPIDDHADLALDAAQEMVVAVRRFSAERPGKKPLRVRIGIQSGVAMAGDFGTSSRSIYTAVGDSVNVASRLEQLAREFPHDIIVGQGTAERAKRHSLMYLGEKLLRGKEHPTKLYTLEPAA
ncbi:MAG TPA: adenylate/guanylate cyclase domain-containing protein [Noviherbaspirillum sp.]|uniref:CHASE2 domain-containing protein n=1 Tax=Noviherbaspirillum sp. TaxID=1926288 RepID=UPI002B47B1DB|nr:adenylate/guanylate cyclase domain-containing protein [Noviherbaspirillum sp.]HJV84305.1 adenylate/guanylate cyclase domain-containing protein [Noviherbaspirillum sp.]